MNRFRGGLAALLMSVGTIVAAPVFWPRPDLAPFVMTITAFNTQRVGFSDGRTLAGTSVYRIDYHDSQNWTWTLISDDVPGWGGTQTHDTHACRKGVYGHIDPSTGVLVGGQWMGPCPGANRWIGYGIASGLPWEKTITGNVVTYTSYGERVSFDLRTGLPLEYEAGLNPGAFGHEIITFRVGQP